LAAQAGKGYVEREFAMAAVAVLCQGR